MPNMPDQQYRIIGAEMSPYSIKVRAWFRYKGIAHCWEPRTAANQEEFARRSRLPLVPLVITPNDENLQDSTVLLEMLEAAHPVPSILPADEGLRFLSALLEEYADEWGNKWMFHLRWARPEDQLHTARRLAQMFADGEEPGDEAVEAVRQRMVSRTFFVGSSDRTAAQIEDSYRQTLQLLEAHLHRRPFLLGQRASLADFGLWGQLCCCLADLTAGTWLREMAPSVVRWVKSLQNPTPPSADTGEWETWESLAGTLFPLLQREVGALFLPWSDANHRALAQGEETMRVVLDGREWTQQPQKYHARSLAAIRQKYAALGEDSWCRAVLAEADCAQWLE